MSTDPLPLEDVNGRGQPPHPHDDADAPVAKKSRGPHLVDYPRLKDLTPEERRARVRESRILRRAMCKDYQTELASLRERNLRIEDAYQQLRLKYFSETSRLHARISELQETVLRLDNVEGTSYLVPPQDRPFTAR